MITCYPCVLADDTRILECYGSRYITERHRHRYEVNNDFRDILSNRGLVLSGISPDGNLVETIEIKEHPFFIGVQFHPEFKSRPNRPHPIFHGFVKSALERKERC